MVRDRNSLALNPASNFLPLDPFSSANLEHADCALFDAALKLAATDPRP
jgi:hypothetical protein